MNLFEMEPMRYWCPSASMSNAEKKMRLELMAQSGDYLWSQKYDGNWARAIITPERNALQTRGISKKTNTYGEVQNKVFFWNNVVRAFNKGNTVILGEIYLPGGVDKDVGSILRCLDDKAIARQKNIQLEWRIFDVLVLDGIDMMNYGIEKRASYIPEVVSRINSSLVKGILYHEMDNNFFEDLEQIFSTGGEGVVCYKKNSIYIPGKRGPHSWDTVKVKREIASDIDCFIIGVEPCEKNYNGGALSTWQYWEDRYGNKIIGDYYGDYKLGGIYTPISKNYYYGWPGAMQVGVYDRNHKIIPLCKIAGLTEEFKSELRDNFDEWYMCPVSIGGMALSDSNGISVRHPYLRSIRKDDISPEDCTLSKIIN